MCRILEVARSGFYAWIHQPLSDRAIEDERLLELIRESYTASGRVYGSPRIFLDLREAGEQVGRKRAPDQFKTITADNGTEFHDYKAVEETTDVKFYVATPYHSWERGSNENFNGLLRQYLPKRTSQAGVTQSDCDRIARKPNSRPRKRLGYRTPGECWHGI